MKAGRLDRSIVIQKKTAVSQDGYGGEVESWGKIHSAPYLSAGKTPLGGSERFTADQLIGKETATFQIRFRADVTVTNRILYPISSGKVWDIISVQEVGRREALKIDAVARAE